MSLHPPTRSIWRGVLDISLGGRCGPASHTLTLFKTIIADFHTLFKTFVERTRKLFIVQEKIP